jgi:DNA-binding winged helix-turn-helix (wHTH) protein
MDDLLITSFNRASLSKQSMRLVAGRNLRQSAKCTLAGAIVIGLLTLLSYRLQLGFNVDASIYLLVVVILQSLTGDFCSSALVAVLAAGCLDYFFVQPLFTFRILRPSDALALATFLITALVITVSQLRANSRLGIAQKKRLNDLFQLSQQLLHLEPEATREAFLEPFQRLFGVTAIAVFDAQTGEMRFIGSSRNQLAQRTREAYRARQDIYDHAAHVSVRCLQFGSRMTGAIGFDTLDDPEGTVDPLAALTSTHLEKERTLRVVARLSAVLPKAPPPKKVTTLRAGDLEIDLRRRIFRRKGEEIHLSPKEFELMTFMMQHIDEPLAYSTLLNSVWGPGYADEVRYVRTYVRMLRKKIEKHPSAPEYILTEPSVGYRFRFPSDDPDPPRDED